MVIRQELGSNNTRNTLEVVDGSYCCLPSMDPSSRSNNASHTALDRTIKVFLDAPSDDTPSKRDGISASVERLHRLHGTSLLRTAWKLLLLNDSINASCYITSCTILHLYLRRVSLQTTNVWSVAMAATLLSAKLHDCSGSSVSLSSIVHFYAHLYRRRILMVGAVPDGDRLYDRSTNNIHPFVASLPIPVTKSKVAEASPELPDPLYAPQPMSPMGPVFQEWTKTMLETENQILRELGFTLYWIPDRHAHKYLPYFLRVLHSSSSIANAQKDQEVAQRAWNYCNDSYRLDVCTRYPSYVIACAAIHLSILDGGAQDQQSESALESESRPCGGVPWWEPLIGRNRSTEVALVANALLGLRHSTEDQVATYCFLHSIHGQAFNDPSSFVWSHAEQQLRAAGRLN